MGWLLHSKRLPALAMAWLSRWLLLEQALQPEPGWLAWQLTRWPQPVFSPLVLQRVWRWPVWQQRQVSPQQV